MNTKRRYIYLKICTLLMFVCLTACNRDPHEEERGMAVTIDNTQCPDVPIGAIKLYIYGTGGNLYATYNYADARGIAAVLHPLEAGHYTVAVVINADEEAAETSTLTALHEWLEMEMSHETNLLSGIAEVNVTEDGISPVTVFLQRGHSVVNKPHHAVFIKKADRNGQTVKALFDPVHMLLFPSRFLHPEHDILQAVLILFPFERGEWIFQMAEGSLAGNT